jgi:hypothetical protein
VLSQSCQSVHSTVCSSLMQRLVVFLSVASSRTTGVECIDTALAINIYGDIKGVRSMKFSVRSFVLPGLCTFDLMSLKAGEISCPAKNPKQKTHALLRQLSGSLSRHHCLYTHCYRGRLGVALACLC